jgi:predicted small lipoprotein YifL
MRRALLLLITSTAAACGQTGSLYLPDADVETPVEIRTAPAAEPEEKEEVKKDENPAEPPGG